MVRQSTNTKVCAGCRREVEVPPVPTRGHPYGWYTLTVNVPTELSRNGQSYRYLGLYCSPECIARSLPYIQAMREKFSQDYTYE